MEYSFPDYQLEQFAEYVYFETMFMPQEIEHILGQWKEEKSGSAVMSSGSSGYSDKLRSSSVQFLRTKEDDKDNKWLYDKLGTIIAQANATNYGYYLRGFSEQLQLTKYGVGDHFNWHMDFGPKEISHRKLSITVQLSPPDSYEGGDLLFRVNDREVAAPKSLGTVVVFPSFIQHKVSPITQGVRRSIVGWASGPPYQ